MAHTREHLERIAAQLKSAAAFQAKSDRYLDRVEACLKKEAHREREQRKKKDREQDE